MAATNDPAPAPTSGAAAASAPSLTNASSALGSLSAAAPTEVPSAGGSQGLEEQEGGPAVARGAFIVLEGLDRSGKTTQVKLLQSRLIEAGRRVQLMRFPGESFVCSYACAGGGWVHHRAVGVCGMGDFGVDGRRVQGDGPTELDVHNPGL